MREPCSPHEAPNGGWQYRDPRNGVLYKDNALNAILQRVYKAWKANDIPVPDDWEAVVKHEICEQFPHVESREIGEPERHVTLEDVKRFGATIKNWLASGEGFVPPEESERRAQICTKCQEYNKPLRLCLGCAQGMQWMAERLDWPQSRHDPKLQGCTLCRCLLRLKIHVPLGVIDNTGIDYPSHCWQKDV